MRQPSWKSISAGTCVLSRRVTSSAQSFGRYRRASTQGAAAPGGVGQEVADLAVVDLAQAAAPLAGHAAGGVPLLGEGRAVQDEDAVGVAQFLGDVAAQFGPDGVVVPAAVADELLQVAALEPGLRGDGLGGLTLQAGELALQGWSGRGRAARSGGSSGR